jgi:hypothetical protein
LSWLALGGAAALQLLAGTVRVRAWFHVIRHSWPEALSLRYRDVVLAHLGGVGWNAVLPAPAGDAVKVAIVNRRTPERRLAMLASTIVPAALVEAVITTLLVAGLLVTSLVSLEELTSAVPATGTAVLVVAAVGVTVVAAIVFRRRLERLLESVRSGLAVLGVPRVVVTRVVPWLLVGRCLRLLGFALILTAAGVPLSLGPALALMALQGATPSAGVAATAVRIAILATVLAGVGVTDVPAGPVAAALAAAYGVTSAVNLAVSAAVIAWLLGTASPRRIVGYVRSALGRVRAERPVMRPSPARPVPERLGP